ncbi:MAG: hypothetical protein HY288_04525 [Planctomycetia bacterium]|nr:hypothetical protein [Planctomycetia bacterium]
MPKLFLSRPLTHFFGRRLIEKAKLNRPAGDDGPPSAPSIPESLGGQIRRDMSHPVRT